MKKYLIVVLLISNSLPFFAQSNVVSLNREKIIGKNLKTNVDIKAREFIFSERIYNSYIDTISNLLTVQLRGTSKNGKWLNNTGNIILYNLTDNTEKWSKKINYQQSSLEQFNNVIIQTNLDKSYCLNIENGTNQWEAKNSIIYVDPLNKIGFGYKVKTFSTNTNKLEGIDLTSGKPIWEREINREYSWNDIYRLNDSIVLVAAAGLHSINLKNGNGWDYNAITGKKDYTSTIAANAVGVVLGVLTGTFVGTAGHDLVKNIVSNIVVNNSNIYFASKENIVSLDQKGKINWSYNLPKDFTSKSSIFIKDSLIFMVNKGYAFIGNRQLDFGSPFIACFNKETGKQNYITLINEKKEQIKGYDANNNVITLLFKNKIAKYSMSTGLLLSEKAIDISLFGELQFFISDQVYIKSDTKYISLTLSDSTKNYIYTKNGKSLVIDDKLEIVNQIDSDQLYICYLKANKLKYLAKDSETIVIDETNEKIADLTASKNATLIGSKLYDLQEKCLIETNIEGL